MVDFDRPAFLLLIPAAILVQWVGTRNSLTRWPEPAESVVRAAPRDHFFAGRTRFGRAAMVDENNRSGRRSAARRLCQHRRATCRAQNAEMAATFAGEPSQPRRGGGVRSRAAGNQRIWRKHARETPLAEKENDQETDLSAALEFAATLLPADRPARIVLFSDGVPTAGRNPIETAAQLQNVEIDTVPLPAMSEKDAAVVSIKLPNSLREGEIFDLSAQVFSTSPVPSASIRVYQNDLLVSEVQRELDQGSFRGLSFRICGPRDAWRSTRWK